MPKCLFCSIKEGIYKLENWDKPGVYEYFCEDHIQTAKTFNNEQEDSFYYHYKDGNQDWLSKEAKLLWERIDKKKKRVF